MSLSAVEVRTQQSHLPTPSIKEDLSPDLQLLFDSYHVILTHNPNQWHLYQDMAKLVSSPEKQSHILLKGAWHALDKGEYTPAQKLSDEAQQRNGATFAERVIDLEILRRQGRERELPKKLLEIAEIFKKKGLPDQEVKAYKRLVVFDPQTPYYQRMIVLYTQLQKVDKASKWAIELSHRQPKQIPVPAAASPRPVQLQLPDIAFGKALWAKYFGDVGEEPPLPPDIHKILSSPCPIWPDKKVRETHLLVLVPQSVTLKGGGLLFGDKKIKLTLKTLGELIQKPLQGNATKYEYFYLGEYKDPPAPKSHWALLSRDVIPGSRNKTYEDQKAQVAALAEKTHFPYEVPTILDATVCILMEYVRTGTRLYSDSPWTYSRCQEKYNGTWNLVVGGFAPGGLRVSSNCVYDNYGVAGLRKFF